MFTVTLLSYQTAGWWQESGCSTSSSDKKFIKLMMNKFPRAKDVHP